jgi:hypothetical protein
MSVRYPVCRGLDTDVKRSEKLFGEIFVLTIVSVGLSFAIDGVDRLAQDLLLLVFALIAPTIVGLLLYRFGGVTFTELCAQLIPQGLKQRVKPVSRTLDRAVRVFCSVVLIVAGIAETGHAILELGKTSPASTVSHAFGGIGLTAAGITLLKKKTTDSLVL